MRISRGNLELLLRGLRDRIFSNQEEDDSIPYFSDEDIGDEIYNNKFLFDIYDEKIETVVDDKVCKNLVETKEVFNMNNLFLILQEDLFGITESPVKQMTAEAVSFKGYYVVCVQTEDGKNYRALYDGDKILTDFSFIGGNPNA